MTRALVLGGGGPVGIGWEAGLAAGFAEAGIAWSDADLIVGTSAGSVVGAGLAAGLDPSDFVALAAAPLPLDDSVNVEGGAFDPAGMQVVMELLARSAGGDTGAMRELGAIARDAPTTSEDAFVGIFATVKDLPWPSSYRCTAVDTESGERMVWSAASGVALDRAIASSCSVPGAFPAVTIDGHRYMDGGMRTAMNADVALGHDVVIGVSCFPPELPEGFSDPTFEALAAAQLAELDRVAAAARLELIAPGVEFLEVSGWGLELMNPSRVQAAFDAGRRQAAEEAGRIREAWAAG